MQSRWLLPLLAVSVFANFLTGAAFLAYAVKVQPQIVYVQAPRPEPPPVVKFVPPAPAIAEAPVEELHWNVPLPKPKPEIRSQKRVKAVKSPYKAKVKKRAVKKKYRAPHVVISCTQVPEWAANYEPLMIRAYMKGQGATEAQVRQVLKCLGKPQLPPR